MSLNTSALSGLLLTTSMQVGSVPLDFVLPGPSYVIVAHAGWWQHADGWADRVVVINGELVQDGSTWSVRRSDGISVTIAPPEDDAESFQVEQARLACDMNREKYVEQLTALRSAVGADVEPSFDAWVTLIKARHTVDAVQYVRQMRSAPREVGVLWFGEPAVDVLAIDARGEAVVVCGESWLESMASMWRGAHSNEPEPPTVQEYVSWVLTQGTHSTGGISRWEIRTAEGLLEAIAQHSLSPTV